MKNNRLMHIRKVRQTDRRQINNLVRIGSHVHRHFDWFEPVELIDHQPFYVAEWKYKLMAALACPPDPERVAWIRFFAVVQEVLKRDAYKILWAKAYEYFRSTDCIVAAIPIQEWFQEILAEEEFEHIVDVVTLQWEQKSLLNPQKKNKYRLKDMQYQDIPEIQKVDEAAFELIWRNSQELLAFALSKSAIATVVEYSNKIIGYQISTAISSGGHLARLAVLPEWQGSGVGFELVRDLLERFQKWGTLRVTVNTQSNNLPSLALYKKVGFQPTDEIYPVYRKIFK